MKIGIEAISDLYQRLYVMRRYNTTPCTISESVASHSYLVSFLSLLLANKKKHDIERVVGMALIHDADESLSGDVSALAKRFHPEINNALENASYEFLSIILENVTDKDYLYSLWAEYKEKQTEESKLVKSADIISRIIPMLMEVKLGNEYAEEIVSNSFIALRECCDDKDLLNEISCFIFEHGVKINDNIRR